MSNVPLPEPAFSLRWERGEHKVSPPMDDCDCYTADQMHAYAASVSAAKDKEIAQLRAELIKSLADNAALRAEVAGLREDAERLDFLLHKLPGDSLRYVLGELSDTSDEAEFRAAIDAARKQKP